MANIFNFLNFIYVFYSFKDIIFKLIYLKSKI